MTTVIYDRIKKLLPQQYKDAPNINAILEVLASPFEDLLTVFEDIKNLLSIDDNEGAQLDLIGDIVGEKRKGRLDVDYRKGIKFKIFKNTSKATVVDVVKIMKFISDASLVVYSDNPPASYTIYTNGKTLTSDIQVLMDKLSAGGVSVIVYASDGEVPFIMTEVVSVDYNFVDNDEDQFQDDGGNNLIVSKQSGSGSSSTELQSIFQGEKMGVVQILNLTTNAGHVIITDTGAAIGVYDEDQEIVDGGKLNLVYQA